MYFHDCNDMANDKIILEKNMSCNGIRKWVILLLILKLKYILPQQILARQKYGRRIVMWITLIRAGTILF